MTQQHSNIAKSLRCKRKTPVRLMSTFHHLSPARPLLRSLNNNITTFSFCNDNQNEMEPKYPVTQKWSNSIFVLKFYASCMQICMSDRDKRQNKNMNFTSALSSYLFVYIVLLLSLSSSLLELYLLRATDAVTAAVDTHTENGIGNVRCAPKHRKYNLLSSTSKTRLYWFVAPKKKNNNTKKYETK